MDISCLIQFEDDSGNIQQVDVSVDSDKPIGDTLTTIHRRLADQGYAARIPRSRLAFFGVLDDGNEQQLAPGRTFGYYDIDHGDVVVLADGATHQRRAPEGEEQLQRICFVASHGKWLELEAEIPIREPASDVLSNLYKVLWEEGYTPALDEQEAEFAWRSDVNDDVTRIDPTRTLWECGVQAGDEIRLVKRSPRRKGRGYHPDVDETRTSTSKRVIAADPAKWEKRRDGRSRSSSAATRIYHVEFTDRGGSRQGADAELSPAESIQDVVQTLVSQLVDAGYDLALTPDTTSLVWKSSRGGLATVMSRRKKLGDYAIGPTDQLRLMIVQAERPAPSKQEKTWDATFVSDMDMPDGTPLRAGDIFQKGWRLRNSGTQRWTRCHLYFVSGERLGGPRKIAVSPCGPGQTVDVYVPMRAPLRGGRFRGFWRLLGPEGPFGEKVYVEVVVR